MFEFIRNMFRNVELEEVVEYRPSDPERAVALGQSMEYYYLDLYLRALPQKKLYMVQEECAGQLLTHKLSCTYADMAWYVRAIFLPSVPPRLVITAL